MAGVTVNLGTIPERSITVDTDGPAGCTMITFCPESCADLQHAIGSKPYSGMSWAIPPAVLAAIKGNR